MNNFASKALFWINIVIIAAICALNYVYQRSGFDFTLKCVCSGGAAGLGAINLCHGLIAGKNSKGFSIAMALGLICAFTGDMLIDGDFVIGAAAFGAGHVCFIIAYCFLQRFRPCDIIPSGIIFLGALAFLLFCPLLSFGLPVYRAVCIAYALIISLMLGKATGNLIRKQNALTIVAAIASALFCFSDIMLALEWFVGIWPWTGRACMGTYYPALCLLAFAMHVASRDRKFSEAA